MRTQEDIEKARLRRENMLKEKRARALKKKRRDQSYNNMNVPPNAGSGVLKQG